MSPELHSHLSPESNRPKRILSLDGGGVRGMITIGILQQIETALSRVECPADPQSFRLCQYFDLIGGTSTGSIIAALLALGHRVEEIKNYYVKLAPDIFPASWRTGIRKPKYEELKIDAQLKELFKDIELESDSWKTGFAVFAKRMDTGSPWVLSNHPNSKYWNDPNRNKDYLVRDVIRASTAAPYFFAPHQFDVNGANGNPTETGLFVDGAVGGMNNPCMELLTMATNPNYPFKWNSGADKLFMLSVGTGRWRQRQVIKDFLKETNVWQAYYAMMGVIQDTGLLNLKQIQSLAWPPQKNPKFNAIINGEIDNMPKLPNSPLLTFRRCNASLEEDDLRPLFEGIPQKKFVKAVQEMRLLDKATPANLNHLLDVGLRMGEQFLGENVTETLCACQGSDCVG